MQSLGFALGPSAWDVDLQTLLHPVELLDFLVDVLLQAIFQFSFLDCRFVVSARSYSF